MKNFVASVSLVFAIVAPAAAHPGGHGEDEMRPTYTGYDCSAMAGDFDAGKNRWVNVYVHEGKVVFMPKGGEAVVGQCVAPLVDGSSFYQRATAKFDGAFAKEFGVKDCCNVHLKGETLIFDKASVTWTRR